MKVEDNIGLVHHVAHALVRSGIVPQMTDDIIQDGVLGLITACRKFKENRGATFSTFAYYYIRGSILDGQRSFHKLPRKRAGQETPKSPVILSVDEITENGGDFPQANGYGQVDTQDELIYLAELLTNKRSKRIFLLRARGHTMAAIGKEFGLTSSRVSQLLKKIKEQLRETIYLKKQSVRK